jgi:hypothetical protein
LDEVLVVLRDFDALDFSEQKLDVLETVRAGSQFGVWTGDELQEVVDGVLVLGEEADGVFFVEVLDFGELGDESLDPEVGEALDEDPVFALAPEDFFGAVFPVEEPVDFGEFGAEGARKLLRSGSLTFRWGSSRPL